MSDHYYASSKEEQDDLQELIQLKKNGVEVAKQELEKVSAGDKSVKKAWRAVERKQSVDYIYVIRHEHGFVKIGWSGNPKRRLSELQKACPYDLTLETTIKAPDGRAAEKVIHDLADEYHERGEWYILPEDFIDLLANWKIIDGDGQVVSHE